LPGSETQLTGSGANQRWRRNAGNQWRAPVSRDEQRDWLDQRLFRRLSRAARYGWPGECNPGTAGGGRRNPCFLRL